MMRRMRKRWVLLSSLLPALLAVAVLTAACGSRKGPEKRPAFRRVTAPVAFEMIRDSPGLTILDVRPRQEFHGPQGHLRGAFSVPATDLPVLLRELAWLQRDTFLVYCSSMECEPEVLDFLHANGFDHAMLIHGGIEAWKEGGFGTVGVGDPPEHDDRAGTLNGATDGTAAENVGSNPRLSGGGAGR